MGKRAVVAGLGKTGHSVIRHLSGARLAVAATDTRPEPPGIAMLRAVYPEMLFSLGALDAQLLVAADCVIASPGPVAAGSVLRRRACARHRGDR